MQAVRNRVIARRSARVRAVAVAAGAALLAACSLGATAAAETDGGTLPQSSVQLSEGLCQTTGGGAFVPIAGFPGESIDQRLLGDIAWMVQRYKIFITDGYSTSSVHAAKGEHPIGLAIDIIPNKAIGG